MLDERKVKLMTRMALYEEQQGREDLKVSAYYRKDYTSLHTLATILWVTIGYICLDVLLGISVFDKLMEKMSVGMIIVTAIAIVAAYLAIIIAYAVYTHVTCNNRHKEARARVKLYNHDLARLLNLYKKKDMKKENR